VIAVEECPNCGAPAGPSARNCTHCKAEFFVKSLAHAGSLEGAAVQKYVNFYKGLLRAKDDDGEAAMSLGICYLQLKLYPLAAKNFAKAIEAVPDQPDVYYYYAFSLIAGRALRTLRDSEVNGILEYLNTAIQMDGEDAKYLFLAAAIRADYHKTNCLLIPPPGIEELLVAAMGARWSAPELQRLLQSVPIRNQLVRQCIERCL
jgi:tetratricopeptide (TPR) repeat protein